MREQATERMMNPPTRLLRLPEVQARTGLDRGGGGQVDPRADCRKPGCRRWPQHLCQLVL